MGASIGEFNTALCKALGLDADKIFRIIYDSDGETADVIVWHLPPLDLDAAAMTEIEPTRYRLVPKEVTP